MTNKKYKVKFPFIKDNLRAPTLRASRNIPYTREAAARSPGHLSEGRPLTDSMALGEALKPESRGSSIKCCPPLQAVESRDVYLSATQM